MARRSTFEKIVTPQLKKIKALLVQGLNKSGEFDDPSNLTLDCFVRVTLC
jgi:hypothetical protein